MPDHNNLIKIAKRLLLEEKYRQGLSKLGKVDPGSKKEKREDGQNDETTRKHSNLLFESVLKVLQKQ